MSSQKKIRDLRRLLQRKGESLSPEERQSIEEKISQTEEKKQDNIHKAVKRKHESKYHMVKFFERKKVTRQYEHVLKRLQKMQSHGAAADEQYTEQELAETLRQLEDDLTYIMYYPVNQKYVALFAHSDDEEVPTHVGPVTLRRSVISGKTKEAFDKAHTLAQQARKNDKSVGKDLVQHAIDVQLKADSVVTDVIKKRPSMESATQSQLTELPNNKKQKRQQPSEDQLKATQKTNSNLSAQASKATTESSENKIQPKSAVACSATGESGDGFFLEEASANDLAPSVAVNDNVPFKGKGKGKGRDFAFVKQAVDHKRHKTHKNLGRRADKRMA